MNALLEAVKSKILEFSPINQQIFSHYLESGTTEDLITAAKGILESEGYEYIQYGTGADAYFDVYKTVAVNAGNGASTEVVTKSTAALSEIVETETGVSTTLTGLGTGSSILATDVGLAGAAIAPALGILAGVGLYNLAPEFWTGISEKLQNAGKLIKGKIQGIFDSNGTTSFDEDTIEIFKQAFLDAGLFNNTVKITEASFPSIYTSLSNITISQYNTTGGADYFARTVNSKFPEAAPYSIGIFSAIIKRVSSLATPVKGSFDNIDLEFPTSKGDTAQVSVRFGSDTTQSIRLYKRSDNNISYQLSNTISRQCLGFYYGFSNTLPGTRYEWLVAYVCFWEKIDYDYTNETITGGSLYYNGTERYTYAFPAYADLFGLNFNYLPTRLFFYNIGELDNVNIQDGATLPTNDPFPTTYPDWQPTKTINNIKYYPVSMPTDDSTQQPSQTGDNSDPEQQEKIINVIYYPEVEPTPTPTPDPDPDPQPEPDPMPEPIVPAIPTNPSDPNPEPSPGDTPVAIIPPSVSVSRLTTVYNPSETQLNSLGAFLWSENIITALLKMWQDPLSGIISLRRVYAVPSTGSTKDIILGYLNSGVQSPIVTSQFTTIDCGEVTISEEKKNATDYTPYVSIQLYLPFIGIVELDPDEIMAGSIQVVYHIDMYTGTCLCEVKVKRDPDVPSPVTIYTYSGNCSQDVPLTSGNMNGLMSTLASLGAVAIGSGSGGMLGMMTAGAIGHSLTHEMLHVNHSGSLSSNAGIMGARKPYILLSRRHGYDANGYSELYGYPSNKTVYLGNCEGYTRVKAVRLKIPAYQQELEEIDNLLKEGIIM